MTSIFKSLPALKREAPNLSRRFFTCRHRFEHAPQLYRPKARASDGAPVFHAFHSSTRRTASLSADVSSSVLKGSSPLRVLSKTISKGRPKPNNTPKFSGYFPDTTDRVVAYWLLGSAASVFGLVVFGGLTRLTESGLSITEWRPVTGTLPPMNAVDWESEFTKYRSSPEFKILNPRMTLDEYKYIYYMEWTHRIWGRVVGITFLLPSIYFIARRKVSTHMAVKLTGICGLIGMQGVLGWWMVKSGLKDDIFAQGSQPRVSQYRLTAHLGTAFLCYTAMLWNGLSILRENRILADDKAARNLLSVSQNPRLRILRRSVAGLAVLVFCTAMSGGLVAGLDAGLIYNDFPYMGVGLTPPKSELFSDFYSRSPGGTDIWWRNMLENPSTVQLDHRIMATITFSTIMLLWAYTRFNSRVRSAMPLKVRSGMRGVVHMVWVQVALGISTLIYLVPLPIASAHQAGSLALLTTVIVLGGRVWFPKRQLILASMKNASLIPRRPAPLGRSAVANPSSSTHKGEAV
ncbi:MAG: Cytochrome c oxidase assembly protein cox15 [Candelina submexicana]|nr:MAG: Cytochrome c oxidase assembly protein cox15 [Candelina submexicana]